MNHVDIILAIPLTIGAIHGFSRGFVLVVTTLAGLVGGVFLAAAFADLVAHVLSDLVSWNPGTLKIIAFVIIFIGVVIMVNILGRFIENIFKFTGLNLINRLAGLVAGILKLAFILSIVLIFFNHVNRENMLMSDKTQKNSFLYDKVASFVPSILPRLDFESFKEEVNKLKELGEE